MEIVTAPDFYSADDARSFVRDLRNLLVELGVCDGKMAGMYKLIYIQCIIHKFG